MGNKAINLGLYGTLLDANVRALVLGEAWRNAGRPAVLGGWERRYVAGQVYPGIRPAPGAEIDVLVLNDLTEEALAAADWFEGDEYERRPLPIAFADAAGGQGAALFYIPTSATALAAEPWCYDDAWHSRHHARFMQEARAAMIREPAMSDGARTA